MQWAVILSYLRTTWGALKNLPLLFTLLNQILQIVREYKLNQAKQRMIDKAEALQNAKTIEDQRKAFDDLINQ